MKQRNWRYWMVHDDRRDWKPDSDHSVLDIILIVVCAGTVTLTLGLLLKLV